jgi:hypothetical protein
LDARYSLTLKFILKRSIIHGVPPTVDLSFARYRNLPIPFQFIR